MIARPIRRAGFRGGQKIPFTPKSLGSALKLWLRADLGFNAGAKTWTCQATGKVFTSSGSPSLATEATLNGAPVIQFGAGGGDVFVGDSAVIDVPAPWCWLVVGRITSGAASHSPLFGLDNKGQAAVVTDAVFSRTATGEAVQSASGAAVGTAAFAACMGSGVNVASLNGTALTHTAMTGDFELNGAQANLNYTVNAGQTAEIILASVADLRTLLRPYVKARYSRAT